ncbi:HemK methyltransferase 1 [Carabus blaptoides fortunei]
MQAVVTSNSKYVVRRPCLHRPIIPKRSYTYPAKTELSFHREFWKNKFLNSNVSEPEESIQNILAHVIGTNKISEVSKQFSLHLSNEQILKLEEMCELRLKSMPVQYIIGEWQFRDLTLKMRPPVFIPRPETELLVDILLQDMKRTNNVCDILDICCGSGAISLAILKEHSNIQVTAIDQSPEACQLTLENAGVHHLENRIIVRQSEVTDENRLSEIGTDFDVIISNPPYVPTADVDRVQPEIKLYEDLAALDGGEDGLSIIRPILQIATEKLRQGGNLYLETDPSHPVLIQTIIEDNPSLALGHLKIYKDFCNKDRFVKMEKL